MNMLLTKEAILSAPDLKSEDVPVPEWGGTVRVRCMTGTERDAFGQALLGVDGKADMSRYRTRLVAATVVDEGGKPIFTADDLEALGGKSGAALARVFDVANRLNGMSADAVEAAEGN